MSDRRLRVLAGVTTLVAGVGVIQVATLLGVPALALLLLAAVGGGTGALVLWAVIAPRIDAVADDLDDAVAVASAGTRVPLAGSTMRRLAAVAQTAERTLGATAAAASTDMLTSVANRSAVVAQLMLEIERAKRHARPLSVAFIDVDRFKGVNDTYGHDAGDAVLRAIARVVRDNVRVIDTFGRYGGEEFLLLMPETEPLRAAETVDRLRRAIMSHQVDIGGGRRISVTVSIGVAGGRGRNLGVETIVRDADAAMYSAKTLGRNQVYVFEVPSDDGVVIRTPIDPAARSRGRELGRAARAAAEAQLLQTLSDLGATASPGPYVVPAVLGMAADLGMTDAEMEAARIAATFHDAGMAAVPQEVLDRPRKLAGDDWARIQQHPRVSQIMLEEAGRLRDAAEIVLHHHERFAGHGYPNGLRGTEIPVGSRILAVADAYQAMREDRPHRRAMSHGLAIAEIARQAGSQFDPTVAALFCRLYAEGPPSALPATAERDERRGSARSDPAQRASKRRAAAG